MTTSRYRQGGSRMALALVVVALVAPLFVVSAAVNAHPVSATATTFVSNHGQQDPDGFLNRGGTVFQGFTTGGNPGGYSLSEITVVLQVPPPDPPDLEDVHELSGPKSSAEPVPPASVPSVEIWSEKGINIKMPGRMLHRLIAPPSVPLDEAVAFTAPPGTALAPNTSYYVRIMGATQVAWDMDREMDSVAADGWSLHAGLMHQSEGANAYATYVPNAIIAVRGTSDLG